MNVRKTSVKVECLKCKKIYELQPYRIKKGRKTFCSKECRWAYNTKVEKICKCGKHFKVWTCRKDTAFYCSNNCKHLYQWDEKRKYGVKRGQTSKDRQNALIQYGNSCELCGWNKLVEVHHIDSNRDNHDIENLCVLCPNCHTLTEHKYRKNVHYLTEEKLKEKLQNGRRKKEA